MRPVESPCMGCAHRRVGCHDPETCPPWAEFLRANEARAAAVRARLAEESMMTEYGKSVRQRYIRSCRRDGKC